MLNVHGLSVAFQGTYLFKDVSFKLGPGDRVGLIGKNGAGKSTLLKLLAKELEADSGQMAADKSMKIGFLKQDIDFHFGQTVLEESYNQSKVLSITVPFTLFYFTFRDHSADDGLQYTHHGPHSKLKTED